MNSLENNKRVTAEVVVNGKSRIATSFVAESNRQLAIVDLAVLQRISSYLPSVSLDEIKQGIMERIEVSGKLEDVVSVMKEEIAFHETVNLINTFSFAEQEKEISYTESVMDGNKKERTY